MANCLWSITWPKWLLPVTIVSDATIRSDIMSRKKWLGCYLHWWPQDWTTAMQHWPVCHWRLSCHYSKFNLAAHLIFELSTPEHVTLCLLQLRSVFHGMCLTYLSNTIEPISAGWRWYGLRSTSSTDYTLPWLRSKFSKHAFSFAGPSTWNVVLDLRAVSDFRKQLKTYFLVKLLMSSNFWRLGF